MMEFLLFLTAKEKEIINLMYKANFKIEENTPLCLLGEKYFGFYKKRQRTIVICTKNAMETGGHRIPRSGPGEDFDRTGIFIRRALRHEAVHAAQSCNNGKPLDIKLGRRNKIHPYKLSALKGSTSISGSKQKEYEAYAMEDKPDLVISVVKKYCL